MAENAVAGMLPAFAEIVAVALVAVHDAEVAVDHGDVTGHRVEQALVPLAGGPQVLLQAAHLGYVHGDGDDQLYPAVLAQDRGGVDHHWNLAAGGVKHDRLATLTLAAGQGGLDGASGPGRVSGTRRSSAGRRGYLDAPGRVG